MNTTKKLTHLTLTQHHTHIVDVVESTSTEVDVRGHLTLNYRHQLDANYTPS